MPIQSSPLVSVVIPSYNQRSDFLIEAVQSVINQTWENLEIIVSDNFSEIAVETILHEIKDERIRIIHPPQHLPIIAHFQFAAENAKGEYISILASDDWGAPDFIESLVKPMIMHPDIVMGYGEIEEVSHMDLNEVLFSYRNYKQPTAIKSAAVSFREFYKLIGHQCGWMVGCLIRTSAFWSVGGFNIGNLQYSADFSFAFHLHELGDIFYLNQLTGRHRSWAKKDGKVDTYELLAHINDMNKIYNILDNSPVLLSYLPNGIKDGDRRRLSKARLYMARAIIQYSQGRMTKEELHKCYDALLILSKNNITIRFMISLTRPRVITVFSPLFKMSNSFRKMLKSV